MALVGSAAAFAHTGRVSDDHRQRFRDTAVIDTSELHSRLGVLPADGPAFGRRPVPAALVCAGGVNAADHAQTFPTLADVLRKQVQSYAAVGRH